MARHDDEDQGPQLVHHATLGVTALPDWLDGVALILRMPWGAGGEQAGMADWIRLCSKEDCALITASVAEGAEDLPPNGVDGFVSFDMQADTALREDFPDMQIVAANLPSRHLAMQAGDSGADALFFGDLRATRWKGCRREPTTTSPNGGSRSWKSPASSRSPAPPMTPTTPRSS